VKLIREIAGGVCVICQDVPQKIVTYDMGNGSVLVERYCEKCIGRRL